MNDENENVVAPESGPAESAPAPEPEPAPATAEATSAPAAEQPKPAESPKREDRPPREQQPRDQQPRGERRDRPPREPRSGGEARGEPRGGERPGGRPDRGDRGDRRGGERGREGRPGGGRPFEGPPEIDIEKLIADSLYLDNAAHAVVMRMRDMDSGTKSQLRRLFNAVRRAVRAPESERQHQFVMLRARLAYTIARHSLRSLDGLERLLLQVTRKNEARGYERFKDLFEAIVAYNE
jgi:CRISPR type III-A-associated protein Csm2